MYVVIAIITIRLCVCGGEILPIEKAIMKNLEGRGCCNDIKNIAELLKEKRDDT